MKDDLFESVANGSEDEAPPDWLLPKLLADIPLTDSSPKSKGVVFSSFWTAPSLAAAMSVVVLFWWSASDRTVHNLPTATDSLFTVSYMNEKDTDPCYLLPPIGLPDKKLSLVIALLLCAAAQGDDFIQNGSFEKRNGEEPAGWFKAAVPADGLKMWLAKGAEEGSHYAAIQNTHRYDKPVANNWAQRIETIPKMKIVRLVARMQTVDAESAVVCIQCWNEKENKLIAFASSPVQTGTKDWQEVQSDSIEIPDATDMMMVRAVLSGTGTVWFDNIKIEIDEKAQHRRDSSASATFDEELRTMIQGEIIKEVDIQQDSMVLSYLPTWDHGNVDNIAVANSHGGVRTMLQWKGEAANAIGEQRVIVALYARKVTALGDRGKIAIQPIDEAWPERVSWSKKPALNEVKCSFEFNDKVGWKLFDITNLCKNPAQLVEHGIVIHFEQENASGADWSGYEFASREAIGEWKGKRPRVLVVK